jgi:osmotically-inducible protein OsmY
MPEGETPLLMKVVLAFLIGLIVGAGVIWFFAPPAHRDRLDTRDTVGTVREEVQDAARSIDEAIDGEAIKEELARSGRVIREKAAAAGEAIKDATSDARITGSIKAKLLAETNVDALKIDVDTTDGVVTLSGTASSHEAVARAMDLAFQTEGVTKVISTIQISREAE